MEGLKDLKEAINENTKVSRRSFLKGLGALSATATIYGCGGGGQSSYSTNAAVGTAIASPADTLTMDPDVQVVMSTQPFDCGGRCAHQYRIKNGAILTMTSLGDIPRAGAAAIDESITNYQPRACVRAYAGIKRTYAPDRLKTPLKQTIARGNLRGFVNITWDEALDTVAGWLTEMQTRQQTLGYMPLATSPAAGIYYGPGLLNNTQIIPYLGTFIGLTGASSNDNLMYAQYAVLGPNSVGNSTLDIFNTKFLLNWAQDPTIKSVNDAFILTKAKEAGIPVLTVSTSFTDTAKTLSTGYAAYNLPAFIQPRPQTDGAILAAMANVIYQKGLHNQAFIKQYCFGFYPGDTATNQATGQTFVCPPGMSFVEYLNGLQTTYGGYSGVLQWASNLSGVPASIIENLAIAYASTQPAMLWGGTAGGQRTNNGMWHCMLIMALAAMTGNTNKQGGGAGLDMTNATGTAVVVGNLTTPLTTLPRYGIIVASSNRFYDIVMNGLDQRTPAQLRADVQAFNGAYDLLGSNPRLQVEMVYGGVSIQGNPVNSNPNTNKNLLALQSPQIKYSVIHEMFLNPTAAMYDIILPAATHHERDAIPYLQRGYQLCMMNKLFDPMYQSMSDMAIDDLLAARMGLAYGMNGRTERELCQERWANSTINPAYKAVYPNATLPSWNEFSQNATTQFPFPPAQAYVGLGSTPAGQYGTDTGKIQFFCPSLFYRDMALGSAYQKPDGGYYRSTYPPKPMYARPHQGYEDIIGGTNVGAKGIAYTLQFTTNHPRNRVHSIFDNVPVIKDQFPTVVRMHPVDAGSRGISNGDTVYVFNDWGCIKTTALLTIRTKPGVVDIQDGSWYRASTQETYTAWFDTNMDGIPEKHTVPVDVGGAPNTLTHDYDDGPKDGALFYADCANNHYNGNLCEVSLTNPQ